MLKIAIRLFLLWISLLFITTDSHGQTRFLMLQKKNKNKNAYYKPGDIISFRTRGKNDRITGEILNLQDSVIEFKGYEVKVSEVTHLYIDEKTKWWLRYKIEQLSLILGGGYLLLNIINTGELNKETVMVSGILIGAGLLARLIIGNKIKISGNTRLRIIEL